MTNTESRGTVEGYERFFGFREPPFSLAPNPRFLFESASHAAALAQLSYAIERREPLVVVTGEIGTGKTLLCRTVLQRIERKTFVSVINDPMLERDDLLKQILQDFGIISKDRTRLTPTSRHDLVQALHEFLASLAPLHAHAVLIVDEAQHLQPDVLEQIRLLSNVDDDRGTLLQIVLVGQTDLDQLLARPELRQFQQRVSRRVRLAPLTEEELRQYIDHRLAVARDPKGEQGPEPAAAATFTPDAIQALASLSNGVPRVVNILCDRALEAAHTQLVRTIDAPLIRETARAVGLPFSGRAADAAVKADARDDEDAFVPSMFGPEGQPAKVAAPRGVMMMGAAALVALALIWFGMRAMSSPDPDPEASAGGAASAPASPAPSAPAATTPPPSEAAGSATSASPASAPSASAPSASAPSASAPPPSAPPPSAPPPSAPPPSAPATPPTVTPPAAAAAAPSTAQTGSASPGAATGQRFEIVVASFRTEARAATVAAEVSALGLPMRQRTAEGWQQVLAGPFASRALADEAQKRLESAGLTGTQIVPTTR